MSVPLVSYHRGPRENTIVTIIHTGPGNTLNRQAHMHIGLRGIPNHR